MIHAVVPPELLAAGVVLILFGGLVWGGPLLYASLRERMGRLKAERNAARAAEVLRREAEKAEAQERQRNEGLR